MINTSRSATRAPSSGRAGVRARLPSLMVAGLIAIGLPRTVLADLGIVTPGSSPLYYVLALTPFAIWIAVAILVRTRRPIADHLVVGTLYGLSLIVVHEALWSAGSSLGHHPPQGAVALAEQFGSPLRELVLHGSTWMIAMMIGLGAGVIIGAVAATRSLLARADG